MSLSFSRPNAGTPTPLPPNDRVDVTGIKKTHCDQCLAIEDDWSEYFSPIALLSSARTTTEMSAKADQAGRHLASGKKQEASKVLRQAGLQSAEKVS